LNPKIATALLRLSACFLLAAIGCGCVGQPALAQSDADSGPEKIGWVPRAILERPVPARQGIGNLHEKVTTSSPQAQAFYDQGLDYLYGYDWIEAARSFNQALRLDPNLAIAYLRLSEVYAQLQDNSAARIACNKAQSLSGKVSERERAQIQIRADHLDYIEDPDSEQKYVAWRKAISDALTANLTDWGLWVLLGSAIGDGEGVESVADYETALAFSPHNSAAHHILAHTFEHSNISARRNKRSRKHTRMCGWLPLFLMPTTWLDMNCEDSDAPWRRLRNFARQTSWKTPTITPRISPAGMIGTILTTLFCSRCATRRWGR
jgi:tetratricopeptide (TPR) repeat protein